MFTQIQKYTKFNVGLFRFMLPLKKESPSKNIIYDVNT